MTDNKSGEILIIEDDKDINDLLATALSKAGYRTRQAWSGTEGELLLKLDREAYALVLLDLMLPGLSGEELLARPVGRGTPGHPDRGRQRRQHRDYEHSDFSGYEEWEDCTAGFRGET